MSSKNLMSSRKLSISIIIIIWCKAVCGRENVAGVKSCISSKILDISKNVVRTKGNPFSFYFTPVNETYLPTTAIIKWHYVSCTNLSFWEVLYDGYNIQNVSDIYSVNTTEGSLTINSVQSNDTGCYVAYDGNATTGCVYQAWNLIVLDQCSTNKTTTMKYLDILRINCLIYGDINEPRVDFVVGNRTFNEIQMTKVDDENTLLDYAVNIQLQKDMNGTSIGALVYFNKSSSPKFTTCNCDETIFDTLILYDDDDPDPDVWSTEHPRLSNKTSESIIIGAVVGGVLGLILILLIIVLCLVLVRRRRQNKLPKGSPNGKQDQASEVGEGSTSEQYDMQPYSELKLPGKADVKTNGIANGEAIHSHEAGYSEINEDQELNKEESSSAENITTIHEYAEVNRNRNGKLMSTTKDGNPYDEIEITRGPSPTTDSKLYEAVPNPTRVVGPVDGTVYAELAAKPTSNVSDVAVNGRPRPAQKPSDLKPIESFYAPIFHPETGHSEIVDSERL